MGFILDYELADSRYIAVDLVWLTFFIALYYFFPKKNVLRVIITIYSIVGFLDEVIAQYDNSILYNDFITDSILNVMANYSQKNTISSSVLYLSDHGENVYDEGGNIGHDYANKLPKVNIEIPFFIWSSSKKSMLLTQIKDITFDNTSKPFMSDDLFHSIIDLNGIERIFLKKHKSIFSTEFNDSRTRIMEDGENYDLK